MKERIFFGLGPEHIKLETNGDLLELTVVSPEGDTAEQTLTKSDARKIRTLFTKFIQDDF